MKVAFRNNDLNELLEILRSSVDVFTQFITHIKSRNRTKSKESKATYSSAEQALHMECLQKLPDYQHIQQAMAAFHQALRDSWSCNQLKHQRHQLKLGIQASVEGNKVHSDLTITCDTKELLQTRFSKVKLNVQSKAVSYDQVAKIANRGNLCSCCGEKQCLLQQAKEKTAMPKANTATFQPNENSCRLRNLRVPNGLCLEFVPSSQLKNVPNLERNSRCLGHIECCEFNFHHTFYQSSHDSSLSTARQTRTIADVIHETSFQSLEQPIQLRIAREITIAILTLHSTPWLEPTWTLKDLSISTLGSKDLHSLLNTIHVTYDTAGFKQFGPSRALLARTNETASKSRTYNDYWCDIKNRPLYSLGVALLEIGNWQTLDANDIVTVRKQQEQKSEISLAYKHLTQRCLECNFGYECGTDLSKQELQEAVCRYVVSTLDRLIYLAEGWFLVD